MPNVTHSLTVYGAWDGLEIGAIEGWNQIKIRDVLNQPVACTVTIPHRRTIGQEQQFAVQQVEMILREHTQDSGVVTTRTMFRGYLRDVNDVVGGMTTATFVDAMWYITNVRTLDGFYANGLFNELDPEDPGANDGVWSVTDMNDGELIRNIVTYCQEPLYDTPDFLFFRRDYGIDVNGENTAPSTTTNSYEEIDVGSAIQEITQKLDGPDWHLSPNKVLNIYHRRGSNRTNQGGLPGGGFDAPAASNFITFTFGSGGNLKSFERMVSADNMITRTKLRSQIDVDVYEREEPPFSYNTFEKYQTLQSDMSFGDLVEYRLGFGPYNRPVTEYRISTKSNPDTDDSQYEVGDIIQLVAADIRQPVSSPARIHGRELTIAHNGSKTADLQISIYG